MRAAVFSDVHGNLVALDAVLAAAAAAGVEEYWIVGDHVAHGPQPAETIARIKQLPSVRAVRGNTDRYVLDGTHSELVPDVRPSMAADDVRLLLAAQASHAWTRGAITAAGHWDWLAALEPEIRIRLPDNTSVLLVHASPGRDEGPGITDEQSDRELLRDRGLSRCRASLIFTGHTHTTCDRLLPQLRVVNVGSVGMPHDGDLMASWTLVIAGKSGYRLEHRVERYSAEAVGQGIAAAHHPTPDWLRSKLLGAP